MIEALASDPAIDRGFQFWTFGYSTGNPIPYSGYLLRRDLDEARRRLDPGKTDPAFDRMLADPDGALETGPPAGPESSFDHRRPHRLTAGSTDGRRGQL